MHDCLAVVYASLWYCQLSCHSPQSRQSCCMLCFCDRHVINHCHVAHYPPLPWHLCMSRQSRHIPSVHCHPTHRCHISPPVAPDRLDRRPARLSSGGTVRRSESAMRPRRAVAGAAGVTRRPPARPPCRPAAIAVRQAAYKSARTPHSENANKSFTERRCAAKKPAGSPTLP